MGARTDDASIDLSCCELLDLCMQAKQYLVDGEEDEMLKMADPALGGRYDAEQLRNVAWAAKLCVQASPDHRPQMSKVCSYIVKFGYWL